MQRDKVDAGRDSVLGKGRSPREVSAMCGAARIATLVEIHSRLSSFYLASPLISASCFTAVSLSSLVSQRRKLGVGARALALSLGAFIIGLY